MSHWRSNPIVERLKDSVEYRHLHVNSHGAKQLYASIGSVAADDGTIAVGIGVKSRNDQGSRALGRAISGGRALRALGVHLGACSPSGEDPVKAQKTSNTLKNEDYFHLFLILAYGNPKRVINALADTRRIQDQHEIDAVFVSKLRETSETTGPITLPILDAILRARAENPDPVVPDGPDAA